MEPMDYCGVVRVVVLCVVHSNCKYTCFIVFSTMLEWLAVNGSVIVVFCLCVLVSFCIYYYVLRVQEV